MLVLRAKNALGCLPCVSKLEVLVPSDISLTPAGSLGPKLSGFSDSPESRGPKIQPITNSRLKELAAKTAGLFTSEPKLTTLGHLSYSSGFSAFSMRVYDSDNVCAFTLKSGKRQQNFDRAIDEQVDVFVGDTSEKLCSVGPVKVVTQRRLLAWPLLPLWTKLQSAPAANGGVALLGPPPRASPASQAEGIARRVLINSPSFLAFGCASGSRC